MTLHATLAPTAPSRRAPPLFSLLLAIACAGEETILGDPSEPGNPDAVWDTDGDLVFADPADAPPRRGPGATEQAWTDDELLQHCAYLDGGPSDISHHNLVVPYGGHLVMPWSPEFGSGGVSFFDMRDPCAPEKVGEGTSSTLGESWGIIRETHAIGFVHLPDDDPHAGQYMLVNMIERGLYGATGIQIWDISDVTNPHPISGVTLSGAVYPDSYNLVTLSLFVQYPYVYTASANAGVHVVDMSDPYAPVEVGTYLFPQGFRAGGVFALGNHLLVTSAEERQAAVLDISVPGVPQLIPGALFETQDATGLAVEAYHGNLAGPYALFARKEAGGGPIVYDISDPTQPTFVGDLPLPGSGGYVFFDEDYLFTGDSSKGHIIDAHDLTAMSLIATVDLPGDLDTLTPWGNVVIASVDDLKDEGTFGQATAVIPWSLEQDVTAPAVMRLMPPDGTQAVPLTTRIGFGFSEMIEPTSATAGAIRLWTSEDAPVPGWVSVQETVASFAPKKALKPGTTYVVELLAGGIEDIHGNAITETTTWSFTTVR